MATPEPDPLPGGTLLGSLLRGRHWQTYGTFRREYDRAARKLDPALVGTAPSRAQLHRWQSGQLRGLPYADHCRVLETMFPGHSAAAMFGPDTGAGHDPTREQPAPAPAAGGGLAGVSAVFTSRAELATHLPTPALLDGAHAVDAMGISLNAICQQYPTTRLRTALADGLHLRCLFLDPAGQAITAREREEGHDPGHIAGLTAVNVQVLQQLRRKLPEAARPNLEIRTYDRTPRLNLLIVDGRRCVAQPYLPELRGVDSPTFVVDQQPTGPGLLGTYAEVFTAAWDTATPA